MKKVQEQVQQSLPQTPQRGEDCRHRCDKTAHVHMPHVWRITHRLHPERHRDYEPSFRAVPGQLREHRGERSSSHVQEDVDHRLCAIERFSGDRIARNCRRLALSIISIKPLSPERSLNLKGIVVASRAGSTMRCAQKGSVNKKTHVVHLSMHVPYFAWVKG